MSSLAKAGAAHGSVITTDYQSAGRGRELRLWIAPPESSLLMSTNLRTSRPLRNVPIVSLLIAGCVAGTLTEFGVDSAIKWPNDVQVRDLKICGILVRSQPSIQAGIHDLIVGIGLNISKLATAELPNATNLEVESGQVVSRRRVLDALLGRIETMSRLFEQDQTDASIEAIEQRLAMLGDSVRVVAGNNDIVGRIAGLRKDGALMLLTPSGDATFVLSGEVQRGPRLLEYGS